MRVPHGAEVEQYLFCELDAVYLGCIKLHLFSPRRFVSSLRIYISFRVAQYHVFFLRRSSQGSE